MAVAAAIEVVRCAELADEYRRTQFLIQMFGEKE